MGILKHEHLSAAGVELAPQLKAHCLDEAEVLELAANRIGLLSPEDRDEIELIVTYLQDVAWRLRRLVEDL
jgi:hypothetical protein